MTRFTKFIATTDSHTAGECTRLVTSGLPPIIGQTMAEKLAYAEKHLSWAPGLLLLEPRGHKDMFGAVLVSPCSPDAQAGVLFMDNQGYEPMCGHAIIGVATTLLETGMVEMVEPESLVTLDTPSGLVYAYAQIEAGRVASIAFENVPAFVYRSDIILETPEMAGLVIDVVFGGLFLFLWPPANWRLSLSRPMPGDWLIWVCAFWRRLMSKLQSGIPSCHTSTRLLT